MVLILGLVHSCSRSQRISYGNEPDDSELPSGTKAMERQFWVTSSVDIRTFSCPCWFLFLSLFSAEHFHMHYFLLALDLGELLEVIWSESWIRLTWLYRLSLVYAIPIVWYGLTDVTLQFITLTLFISSVSHGGWNIPYQTQSKLLHVLLVTLRQVVSDFIVCLVLTYVGISAVCVFMYMLIFACGGVNHMLCTMAEPIRPYPVRCTVFLISN